MPSALRNAGLCGKTDFAHKKNNKSKPKYQSSSNTSPKKEAVA
jgi:hypothetical protein